jgi:hypothetical protein
VVERCDVGRLPFFIYSYKTFGIYYLPSGGFFYFWAIPNEMVRLPVEGISSKSINLMF